MAMSHSLLECGNDEVVGDVVTDLCFKCGADGKLQPALYFCFECGVYGRYMCGMCLETHNKFINNHEVEKIANHSTSRRAKDNEGKMEALQQLTGEIQKRIRGHPYMTGLAIAGGILLLGLYGTNLGSIFICCLVVLVNIHISKQNDDKLKTLQQSNGELQMDNSNLQIEKTDLKRELNDFKLALDQAKDELKTKDDEFDRKSAEYKNTIIDIVKEKDDLLSRSIENDGKLKALTKSNGELRRDAINLSKEKSDLKKELDDCKVALDLANNGLKKKIENFDRESTEFKNRIMDIAKERDDALSRSIENDGKLKALTKSNGELRRDTNNRSKEISDLKKELDDCKVALDLANNGLKKKNEKFDRESTEFKNRIMDIAKERDDAISRAKENDCKLTSFKQSNGNLQKETNKLQKEKADLEKELHGCKVALELANDEIKTKTDDFNRESTERKKKIMNIAKERDDLISRLRKNDTKVKSLMTSNEKLQWDKSSLETDRVKLLTTVDEVKKENENLAKELHHYKVEKMDQTETKVLSNIVSARELRVKDNRKLSLSMCDGGARLSKENKMIVAAIEIGNSSSGYAFSFRHNYEHDPSKISSNNSWFDGSKNLLSIKTPTVVLFDVKKKFHSFGYEAENVYAELVEDDNYHEWYFFRRFMSTLQEEKIDINYLIADDKGKEMKFIDVLSAVIKYLKDHFLKLVETIATGIQTNDIHWVIPVQAIWTETANQIMREAAYKADINSADLTLVSEPVAASLCCQMIPIEKLRCSKSVKYPAKLLSSPGQKFMVIDLGGYSAGFTILERQSDGGLMEVKAATGVGCGANMVYSEFLAFCRNILSDAIYQKCIDESMDDYIDLQREFDTKIRTIKPDFNGKVTYKVSVSFGGSFKKMKSETIQDHIERSQYKGKVRWLTDRIRIDAEMVKDMFKPCTDMIVGYLQELQKYKDVQGTGIFLMVGGFSESFMVQEAVIKAFPNVNVIVPEKADCAVMKGAVIYGHQHRSTF